MVVGRAHCALKLSDLPMDDFQELCRVLHVAAVVMHLGTHAP